LRTEPEYLTWVGISTQLGRVRKVWWDQGPIPEDLDALERNLFTPIVRKLGYEYPKGEDVDTVQLRSLAIGRASAAGSKEVVATLKGWFDEYVTSKSSTHIPPDLIRPTFTVGGKYGEKREWEALRETYLNAPNPSTKTASIMGLCHFKNPELRKATMDLIMDGVRAQDVFYFIAFLGRNPDAGRETWEFLKQNYDELYKRFEGNFQITYFVEYAAALLNAEKDAENFSAFFKDKNTSKLTMTLPQALDGIHARAAWLERSKDDVAKWFEEWKKSNSIEEKA